MSALALTITSPGDGEVVEEQPTVRLDGTVAGGPPGLFYKWYSSLHVPADPVGPDTLPLNRTFDAARHDVPLAVGSHVITFTAKDVLGESEAALQGVTRAGLAGGPLAAKDGGTGPYLVHVLIPRAAVPGGTLSRASGSLRAVAPTRWDKDEYQAVNRIGFRWTLAPRGQPSGRRTATVAAPPATLTFIAKGTLPDPPVPLVSHPMPAEVDTGPYTLTLEVFLIGGTPPRAQPQDVDITITP